MSDDSGQPDVMTDPERIQRERALIPYPHGYAEQEFDLVDVGVGLWRRWALMVAVFLIFLALGIAYALVRKPKYEYAAVMQVGTISAVVPMSTSLQGRSPLIQPASAAILLKTVYIPRIVNLAVERGSTGAASLTIDVKVESGSNDITLTTRAGRGDAATVVDVLSGVVAAASEKINARLAAYLQRERKYLGDEIGRIEKREKSLQAEALQLAGNAGGNAAAASYVAAQVAAMAQQAAYLRRKLEVLLPSNVERAGLAGQVTRSSKPISPSAEVIAVIGGFIGIVLALLAAAFVNYAGAVRRRLEATGSARAR